ncbi:hypothetical protein MMC20_001982 [Loxospora ochrophaea]|nr:hypothetical protein [Loxospora ochrophaea]
MPPFVARKRRRSNPPQELVRTSASKATKKPTLFDTLDKPARSVTLKQNQSFLDKLHGSDSDSSLSDISSSEFEDALPSQSSPKRRKIAQQDEDEDEIDWEDAIQQPNTPASAADVLAQPPGDLELTLGKEARIRSSTDSHGKKKGPSKIERQIRVSTHCLHVQFLLFHNAVRNAWVCDEEVQKILVQQLPGIVQKEVGKWKLKAGMTDGMDGEASNSISKGRKAKRKNGKGSDDLRSQRDWGRPAERQERGAPDTSKGDPIFHLLKTLVRYWKKRFRITAPGLRKHGYKSLAILENEIASFQNDEHDPEEHGERIADIEEFRQCARACEGSRDVGAQLFTALIRGMGIEARLVASLQPVGFGWNKGEEASTKKRKKPHVTASARDDASVEDDSEEAETGSHEDSDSSASQAASTSEVRRPIKKFATSSTEKANTTRGKNAAIGPSATVIKLSSDSEPDDKDDESVIDVTPSNTARHPNMNYDRDLPFPTYWSEIVSPVTHEVHPVDPMVLMPSVVTTSDQLANFEPRGAKAEKGKQVFAYVVAYSPDGTAKDVTTRYLKRHVWPGKTKGVRLPIEKIPIRNKSGKIKRYEEYDWFKSVMSGYTRTDQMRTIVDDIEEAKDLKAVKMEKKGTKQGEETLQGYKNSAEFVLERHLRREEALVPGAEPVKTFLVGKGEKAKNELVFRRDDVVICRTGESWHKEGRKVKPGEYPLKSVPVRAVTLARKREVEEAERDGGEKLKQGMYAKDQTEWIIPPPIENGVIPTNAYGNIDCFVPSMVPSGAVHIPLKGTTKICKRLGIDFAEAVTGFEFGKQRAVPVVVGVVVASENEDLVIDEWEKDEVERQIKEEGKREKAALGTWRKFLMGLRIVQRVRDEYGDDSEANIRDGINPFTNKNKKQNPSSIDSEPQRILHNDLADDDHDMSGGFLQDELEDSINEGFIHSEHNDERPEAVTGGGFVIEDEAIPRNGTPMTNLKVDLRTSAYTESAQTNAYKDMETGNESELNVNVKSNPNRERRARLRKPNSDGPKSETKHSLRDRSPPQIKQQRAKGKDATSRLTSRSHRAEPVLSSEPKNPDLVPSNHSDPRRPKRKRASIPKPKRKAAIASQTALKSHYFDKSPEIDEGTSNQSSASEDELNFNSAVHQRDAKAEINRGSSKAGLRRSSRKTM